MADIIDIRIERPRGVSHQICDSIRNLIHSGELKPGARLPSTSQLALRWKTDPKTIHKALAPLVKEGLLARCAGLGTFVRQREQKLTCVGIYNSATGYGESRFGQAVHTALQQELTGAGIEMDVWLDPRPDEQNGKPWLPLVQAARNRKFQALIVTATGMPRMQWVKKLPVPIALVYGPDLPNAVNFDFPQMAEISLQALAQQGCRSVGLIAPWATKSNYVPDAIALGGFFDKFGEVAQELGLQVQNQWMRLLPHEGAMGERTQAEYGYRQFLELWQQDARPDGLIVYPDTVVHGVILALREQQVRVPAELKLVLHKNEAIELFCPMPATFVVSSERMLARALIAQVKKQFRGEACEPILIRLILSSRENEGKLATTTGRKAQ